MQALAAFEKAARLAAAKKNPNDESAALLGESACNIFLFRYREALDASERAFAQAKSAHNDTRAGAAAINKAAIYDQLGDEDSAGAEAEQAVALLEHSSRQDYRAQALLSDGDIQRFLRHTDRSKDLFKRAIAVAQGAKLTAIEALAEDHLGFGLVTDGDYSNGRKYLEEAERIRTQSHDSALLITQTHLAELHFDQGDYQQALRLIGGVLESKGTSIVSYWAPELKGKILLALGHRAEALACFTTSVRLADQWRQDVLPAESTSTQTAVHLAEPYEDYVQTAATLASEHANSDATLARKALMVLIASRAWSLRDQLLTARSRELRLPPRYYELLSELENTQAVVTLATDTSTQQRDRAKLKSIEFELTDLENQIGIHSQTASLSQDESGHLTSLGTIQSRLGSNDLLLSFYLGAKKSFLWSVARHQVRLYELPASSKIASQAHAFKEAVHTGTGFDHAGAKLSQTLFGQLPARVADKRNWLITANGALLDGIPFAALPLAGSSHSVLVQAHTLRILPSEALLTSLPEAAPRRVFVGVGDPIYNAADSRHHAGKSLVGVSHTVTQWPALFSLGRLVGSDREVWSAAVASGLPTVHILTGTSATGSKLAEVLAERPEILHFAVHVVSPDAQASDGQTSDEAAIALSLTDNNAPELLTRESIAAMRVPGTLVVLSGCSSQQGTVLPSVGVVGLSRAWLLAGASAVLVTAWPTPDDSGVFFKVFYGYFRTANGTVGQRAAAALQQTQSDMKAGSGYRSEAAFWSAYSLISKQ